MRWTDQLRARAERLSALAHRLSAARREEGQVSERVTHLTDAIAKAWPWSDKEPRAQRVLALAHYETARTAAEVTADDLLREYRRLTQDYRAALDVLEYIASMRHGLPGQASMETLDDVCGTARMAVQEAEGRMEDYGTPIMGARIIADSITTSKLAMGAITRPPRTLVLAGKGEYLDAEDGEDRLVGTTMAPPQVAALLSDLQPGDTLDVRLALPNDEAASDVP